MGFSAITSYLVIDGKYILDYYYIEYTMKNNFSLYINKAKVPVFWFAGTYSLTLMIDTQITTTTEHDGMLYTIKNINCCI